MQMKYKMFKKLGLQMFNYFDKNVRVKYIDTI